MKKNKTLIMLLVSITAFVAINFYFDHNLSLVHASEVYSEDLNSNITSKVDHFIQKQMKKSKIPGLSVLIIKGDQVYKKCYGYKNIKQKTPVTEDTLFELGSNSKAFTGLGILKLESEGKLSFEDTIDTYLPWFQVYYKGKSVPITIEQLLHHTSGIPYKSIGDIPIDSSKDALQHTVRCIVNTELDRMPGSSFEYATLNYDILGLIISTVSGEPYDTYMYHNILKPMGLDHIYLSREVALEHGYSNGYKIAFRKPLLYASPEYKGNLPAGYFISDINEMEKWMRIQLGEADIPSNFKELVDKSHIADRTVAPEGDGSSYAIGWTIFQSGEGLITHGGNNPNFSSSITLMPSDKLGIVVLANMNSSSTDIIGQSIVNILLDRESENDKLSSDDMYTMMDYVAFTITIVFSVLIIICFVFMIRFVYEVVHKKRKHAKRGIKGIFFVLLAVLFNLAVLFCIYKMPYVLFYELNWGMVYVWGPISIPIACCLIFGGNVFVCLYFLLCYYFPKKDEKSLFYTVILSVLSGFGNAMLIFIVNEALNRNSDTRPDLLIYLFFGVIVYVLGQKLVRTKLINITNNIALDNRILLINKILNSSFNNFEKIESGKIQAGLNNDTEAISNIGNLIVTGLTHSVTLLSCFIYFALINVYAFWLTLFFLLVAVALYAVVGLSANIIWQQTRTMQNSFFQFITDLINGFKELSLSHRKKEEFKADMLDNCISYRDKQVIGNVKFTNVFVIGELLFISVIAIITFLFPEIFKAIQIDKLKNYVFVLLYMTGPINGILGIVPSVIQVRVNWNRLNELVAELSLIESEDDNSIQNIEINEKVASIELKEVMYTYKNEAQEPFCVGPINYTFKPGEIAFITGGNGSGKSTLAKLLTGLYKPDSGSIYINHKEVEKQQLSELFSAIFSDFYLFQRLYGVDCEKESQKIQDYLEILHIDKKVQIAEGKFSSLNLSTGQRKRIALLLSYLDDRPFYLFDEVAADQDPEFRAYFYNVLLQEFQKRGKCIIAVTHDDRYFHLADKLIKMDMGKIVDNVEGL